MKALIAATLFACTTLAPWHAGPDDGSLNNGAFVAMINGRTFKLRDDQLFRGLLVTKSPSMDGRTPARTVISTVFNGPTYSTDAGKEFNESISVEIDYHADKTGPYDAFAFAMQYESTNYFMLRENCKLNVTQFAWEEDKKHFRLSADFDCKMRSWGYPGDGSQDVALKGRMSNVRITVPSWLVQKN